MYWEVQKKNTNSYSFSPVSFNLWSNDTSYTQYRFGAAHEFPSANDSLELQFWRLVNSLNPTILKYFHLMLQISVSSHTQKDQARQAVAPAPSSRGCPRTCRPEGITCTTTASQLRQKRNKKTGFNAQIFQDSRSSYYHCWGLRSKWHSNAKNSGSCPSHQKYLKGFQLK